MMNWLNDLIGLSSQGQSCALVTVAHTAASAPREAGTKMLVTAQGIYGTIGGGNLEYNAIKKARSLLAGRNTGTTDKFVELYALGPMLEQCCGGVVFLHYELIGNVAPGWLKAATKFYKDSIDLVMVTHTGKEDADKRIPGKMIVTGSEVVGSLGSLDGEAIEQARHLLKDKGEQSRSVLQSLSESKGSLPDTTDALLFDLVRLSDFHVVLYGAGHVGSAIVNILASSISCRISWIDNRAGFFPDNLPLNVNQLVSSDPVDTVKQMPARCFYLVMTHSHGLDRSLCRAILQKGDFRFLGLIGSQTKIRRFRKYLLGKGISEQELARLTCPVGIDGITSKEPGAIAVSVVAQLLQDYEAMKKDQVHSQPNENVDSFRASAQDT